MCSMGLVKNPSMAWDSLFKGPPWQSLPVIGVTGRLFSARKSGFGVSAIYRIKHLLQNISHTEPGGFRGRQEIEVSPAKGNIISPEGTRVGVDPPAEI